MKVLEKLKTIKRKWIYIGLALLIVVVGLGGTAAVLHERFDGQDWGEKDINGYQTYYDLLSLENTDNMKLSPEQAKAILPLAEKLVSADKTTQPDLEKSIYTQLTPQQYYSLLNGNDNTGTERGNIKYKNGKREEEFRGERKGGEGLGKIDVTVKSLQDVVIKMLKGKSTK
jgi:hypothetical protein